MFELLAMGFDMHKRVIDLHMQGVEATRDMVSAMERNVETAMAANQAGEAGMKAMKSWLRLWGGRA